MRFKDAIEKIEGLRLLYDITPVVSPLGRIAILESKFITDPLMLQKELQMVEIALSMLEDQKYDLAFEKIERALMHARDIFSSLRRLEDGAILDDVELFEVKGLAMTSEEVRKALLDTPLGNVETVMPPELEEVVELLDPEHTGSRHFHIYTAYSRHLMYKRRELEDVQKHDMPESLSQVMAECIQLENAVRKSLSMKLFMEAGLLLQAIECVKCLDFLLARARLARTLRLVRPVISSNDISYLGLRFLPVERMLEALGKSFQPVDIRLEEGVTMITGANMGGKTITLRSVAMAQAMAQFGYFVPALKARISPVDGIQLSMGDGQSAMAGLSSFGAEIVRIDDIIRHSFHALRYLNLIDEPARTTNPEEGRAIVNALVELLGRVKSYSLVTTHYSGIEVIGRRYRVKGLREGTIPARITPSSLGEMMDYGLESHDGSDVSREALRIARMLSIDPKFASAIEGQLKIH